MSVCVLPRLGCLRVRCAQNGTGAAEIAPVDDALGVLGSYGFNHFLVSLYANHSAWSGSLPHTTAGHIWWAESTRNSPWSTRAGGGGIDYSHLNLRFLRQWDAVLDAADRHGLVIHLMMYVGNKNVNCTATSTSFWTDFRAFLSSTPPPTCAVYHVLLRAHADRVLIGAWDPTL